MKIKIIIYSFLLIFMGLTVLGVWDSRAEYIYETAELKSQYNSAGGDTSLICGPSGSYPASLSWYLGEGRCATGSEITYWSRRTKSDFDIAYDRDCLDYFGTTNRTTCNTGLLCSSGYTYVSGTDDCRKYVRGYDCGVVYSDWSTCTADCDEYGTQSRSVRNCSQNIPGSTTCYQCTYDTETRDCYGGDCAPSCSTYCWSWSSCSAAACGTYGTQTRTCRRTDCSTYTQSQTCYAGDCITNDRPTATINSPSNGTSIIVMNSLNFSGSGSDTDGYITAYSWNISAPFGTITETSQNFTRTFGNTGSYQACLSVRDDDGAWSTNSACVNFSVNDTPPPPNQSPTASITSPSGNRTITAGQSISFSGTGSDPDGSITSYRWNSGSCSGTQLSSSSSFTRTFSSAGTYRIYFSVRDDDGAWSTNCPYRTITVDDPCVDTIWTPSPSTVCVGTSLTQTGDCGTTRVVDGTGTCNLSGYSTINHSCSSNILTTTERWYSYYCVSGGCSSPVLVDTNSSTENCNTGESCATATSKSRCHDISTVQDYKEFNEGICNASGGSCDYSNKECDIVTTPCEDGYICKETGPDQAECVPKATTWTET